MTTTDATVRDPVGSGSGGTPEGYLYFDGAPSYTSASQISVPAFLVRNSANDDDISKASATTVDISTTGLNGVAQSANLAGTVVTSGTSVTGTGTAFTTDFQVGDVIDVNTDGARRITVIGGATSITVDSAFSGVSGQTYKRGGEAPDTWYNLYCIDDGTTDGTILSTRNVAGGDTLVDLPSGYNKSRQIAFCILNDSSSDILRFNVGNGFPTRPYIQWEVAFEGITLGSGDTVVLNVTTSATSFTDVDCSAFVPPISRYARFICQSGQSGQFNQLHTRDKNASHAGNITYCGGSFEGDVREHGLDSSQTIQYHQAGSVEDTMIEVRGFVVTEVG